MTRLSDHAARAMGKSFGGGTTYWRHSFNELGEFVTEQIDPEDIFIAPPRPKPLIDESDQSEGIE